MRCVTLTNSRAQVAMSEAYECNALTGAENQRFLAKRAQTLGETSRVGSGAPGNVVWVDAGQKMTLERTHRHTHSQITQPGRYAVRRRNYGSMIYDVARWIGVRPQRARRRRSPQAQPAGSL